MKGEQPATVEALRMSAVPEGSDEYLVEFLKMYRDAVQMIVNGLWRLNEKLSRKKLHELFYGKLRKLGLRVHHVKQIYTYAQSVVISAKSNGGKKPILRKLTARIDRHD
uniref:Uncharacterized protein n=2 Tax=Ignisphaera aggregans TaxID=334771 RepID=A0A7J3Z7K4_9CREN